MSLEDIRNYLVRMKAFSHAVDDYHPQRIPGPIHLFRATDYQSHGRDGHLGWAKVLPETDIRVIPVPGTHFSMMLPPQIERLGRSLSEALGQASAAKTSLPVQVDETDRVPEPIPAV